MKTIECLSVFCFVFIFSYFHPEQAFGTGIDGDAISSSFTITGPVTISTLTANSIAASTITLVSSATIANLTARNLTSSSLSVSTITAVSSATITNMMITNRIIVPNGVNSTDAAAFGQLGNSFQPAVMSISTMTTSTTSSTFQVTSLAATITPMSSSHRIKITVTGQVSNDNGNLTDCLLIIKRGATNILGSSYFATASVQLGSGEDIKAPIGISYIDSPSTTGSTTYTVYIRSSDNSNRVAFNDDNGTAVMILEEIQ